MRRYFLASLRAANFRKPKRLNCETLEDRLAPAFAEFLDPNPFVGNAFGNNVVPLPNGNIVVTSPFDNFNGSNSGAVYLFNGTTGALISALRGSAFDNAIGNLGITVLASGNFVVRSSLWDNPATGAADAGAVTFVNGTTGLNGVVSAANSLVGSTAGDKIGSTVVTALANGNYVVRSSSWDFGPGAVDAGAVTWGSGTKGVSGAVSSANSLVSSTGGSAVGNNVIIELSNGHYVVRSLDWDNGAVSNVGAVTWANGNTGVSGVISATNSLIGSTAGDTVGNGNVIALPNGNYVVSTPAWDNGAATNAGALTWCDGDSGLTGVVGATNSLVGSKTSDLIGINGLQVLANGNFLVRSADWDNGAITNTGAVTFVNGLTGLVGAVSAANSLVGSAVNDNVGTTPILLLANGNYVVATPSWNNGGTADAGAATWGSGATGVSGAISVANSLVGDSIGDNISSSGVFALSNGNYVVTSSLWDDAVGNVGAATWGNGATGIVGVVSNVNSLVGSALNDNISSVAVLVLPNGNYVVRSHLWNNGAATKAGAVTWCNGATGLTGPVTAANSLVGSTANDNVGLAITALANGHYVVRTSNWDNGVTANVGAITWGSGTAGVSGTITLANSLIGTSVDDQLGQDAGITVLPNGNYVVRSALWDNSGVADAGAITWCNGLGGTVGQVNAANSLVGSTANDLLGGTTTGSVQVLPNGNYVVASTSWDNGSVADTGAITWGSGTAGVSGVISTANSLVGSKAADRVGSNGTFVLANGNYVVVSLFWDNDTVAEAGAVTWGSGTAPLAGVLGAANSLVGSSPNDQVGSNGVAILSNGNYVVRSPIWDNDTQANAGAATWGRGTGGVIGTISAANSLVGSKAEDQVGGSFTILDDGDYLVTAPNWDHGIHVDAGMMAWGSGSTGVSGVITSANALVGLAGTTLLSVTPIIDNVNDAFYARFTIEQFGGRVRVGSQSSGVIPTQSTVYVDDGFAAFNPGATIPDADIGTPGNQPATFGVNAFATIPLGQAALVSGGSMIINVGTYADNVVLDRDFTWKPGGGDVKVSGTISGPFGIRMDGISSFELDGVNTFIGNVECLRGKMEINADSGLGNPQNTVMLTGLASLTFDGPTTTSRDFELGGGKLVFFDPVTLIDATISDGFISGFSPITTNSAATSVFLNCEFLAGNALLSVGNDLFRNVENSGFISTVAGKTVILDYFTNTSSGVLTINGAVSAAQFTTNGQMTVAGTITSFGGSTQTFGGGSVTTINSGGSVDVGFLGGYVAGGLVKNSGTFSTSFGTPIIVDFNGRVQGAGTFGSIVTQNGGVFAPGGSPGTATTNQFNLNGGGTLEFEVTNASGTPGLVSGWDLVNVQPTAFSPTGLMNYTSTPASKYLIQLKSRLDDGIGNTPGNAVNFNSALPYAWKFADGSNALTSSSGTFNAANFQIDTSGFSNAFTGGFGVELLDGGKNLYVVYTPVAGPIVTGFIVNNGNIQRSRLTTIQVNFAAPVDAATLQPVGAITLTRTAATPSGTVGTIVDASNGLIVAPASGMVSSVTLTFSSISNAGINFGSLADGRWRLAIPSASFQSGLNDPILRRLFGDGNNDGTVDGNDLADFGAAFGSTGVSPFDFNNDLTVDALDFGEFGNRFGLTL